MRKVMFALAIVAGAFMAVGPASAQCTYRMIDVGRPMGYSLARAMALPWVMPGHTPLILIHPHKPIQLYTPRRSPHRSTAVFASNGRGDCSTCRAGWGDGNQHEDESSKQSARQCQRQQPFSGGSDEDGSACDRTTARQTREVKWNA
jgi:hypothetical protein